MFRSSLSLFLTRSPIHRHDSEAFKHWRTSALPRVAALIMRSPCCSSPTVARVFSALQLHLLFACRTGPQTNDRRQRGDTGCAAAPLVCFVSGAHCALCLQHVCRSNIRALFCLMSTPILASFSVPCEAVRVLPFDFRSRARSHHSRAFFRGATCFRSVAASCRHSAACCDRFTLSHSGTEPVYSVCDRFSPCTQLACHILPLEAHQKPRHLYDQPYAELQDGPTRAQVRGPHHAGHGGWLRARADVSGLLRTSSVDRRFGGLLRVPRTHRRSKQRPTSRCSLPRSACNHTGVNRP